VYLLLACSIYQPIFPNTYRLCDGGRQLMSLECHVQPSTEHPATMTAFRALLPTLLGFVIFSTCAAPARASASENWPQRPIRLVVSAPAASSVDIVGRVLADGLKEKWGQAVMALP
jgi:hypothetical protein